jgi:hypothetical protein
VAIDERFTHLQAPFLSSNEGLGSSLADEAHCQVGLLVIVPSINDQSFYPTMHAQRGFQVT